MKPGVLGIGAQKCASSWIHAVAGSHPGIGLSEPKEVDFFSYYFDRGYRWYESHFPETGGAEVYFECSPSYFHDPRAPDRAAAYRPELKVLALLRDPVKRAFSNHMHEIIKGHIPPCTFEDGLENNPAYLEQGLYATHLKRWLSAFPAEQVKVLFAEDVAASPTGAATAVFSFFGVDPGFDSAILHERRNESDRARSAALRAGLRAGGRWMRQQGLEGALARIKAVSPVAGLLRANSVQIRDEIPPMQPETAHRLEAVFAPEMEALQALLNRPALPWQTAAREAAG
ncbi:sulfotransferase (plasmid) [Leisingera sp. NJS201]|uniref:sulfotransferase domain-containing protein n=1 Tax=Leisingera sp. NJS201 TaxID=2508306 RepID=UPI001070F130|nr:sulfotransferase domain-containing protein [Leisingera sp. NJS201]QBR38572.1 sulfotransferase [Leisingera sp. NJS201]